MPKAKPTKAAKSKESIKGTEPAKRDIQIVNIVVSSSLGHDIPLEKMAATLSNTEYNPEQFPGLVIRIKEPKTSALIFSSGKIVCTGARTMHNVEESIKKIIKSLEKIKVKITVKPVIKIQNIVAAGSIGMDLNLNKLAMIFWILITGFTVILIKIQNIVAAGSIGMDLNLNKLAMKLENTEYEPEQFPGLVYKLGGTEGFLKATFLLFSNGKIVCTGTKSEEEARAALDKLVENLKKVKA